MTSNLDGTAIPEGFRLIYLQRFQDAASLAQFVMTDPKAWRFTVYQAPKASDDRAQLIQGTHEGVLELAGASQYKPPHRSPFNIAFIRDRAFGDFVLEVDLLQTGKEYGHRDMCLFFGFQDPDHFYYVHMASRTDAHAHNIFIVNEAPRLKISTKTTPGIEWGNQQWHTVRLVRGVSDGTIKVFFDDMSQPIMEARDTRFGTGYVGFGSFDDTGMVDNIRIWAKEARKEPIHYFKGIE